MRHSLKWEGVFHWLHLLHIKTAFSSAAAAFFSFARIRHQIYAEWNPCIKLAHPHVSRTTLNHNVCVVKMQITDARLLFWDNVVSLYWECRSLWEHSQETKHMCMLSTHMRTFSFVVEGKNYDCNRFPWSCFKSLREDFSPWPSVDRHTSMRFLNSKKIMLYSLISPELYKMILASLLLRT